MHSGVSSFPLLLARTPPSSILVLLLYGHHWGLSRWRPCTDPRGHGPRPRISTDAVTQRTFTGSGSAPTAQMEPLYRSGQQGVHQHYWPEERGVAARLVTSRSGRTSRPGDPRPKAPEPTGRTSCCPTRVPRPTSFLWVMCQPGTYGK